MGSYPQETEIGVNMSSGGYKSKRRIEMLKRLFVLAMMGMFAFSSLYGCYSTGKATGEAAEEVEEGASEFEKGYEEGKE